MRKYHTFLIFYSLMATVLLVVTLIYLKHFNSQIAFAADPYSTHQPVSVCEPCCNNDINDHFFECLGPHGECVEMDCVIFDHDGDCDVDIKDFAQELCPKPIH